MMTYEKKLLIAKMLVSVGLCVFVLIPLTMGLGASQASSGQYGHLIALPIMLWVIWGSKLHGTGRSVRLMAYLGLAFVAGFYMSAASHLKSGASTHNSGHENMMLGMNCNVMFAGTVFILLLSGVFISIRPTEK